MTSRANLDEEDLALALTLSQQSSNDLDEHLTQLPTEGSASANHISRPCTPFNDEKDDLALALRLSLLSSDDFDEQVTQLHRAGPAPMSEEAHSSTLPNESNEDDLELTLNLSQLPADIFDEQVNELNRRRMRMTQTAAEMAISLGEVQVRITLFLYLNEALTIVLVRYARRCRCPASLERHCLGIVAG